jgi:hypothetical protein
MNENKKNGNDKRRFSLFDYWFHAGVVINLTLVAMLLWWWYARSH